MSGWRGKPPRTAGGCEDAEDARRSAAGPTGLLTNHHQQPARYAARASNIIGHGSRRVKGRDPLRAAADALSWAECYLPFAFSTNSQSASPAALLPGGVKMCSPRGLSSTPERSLVVVGHWIEPADAHRAGEAVEHIGDALPERVKIDACLPLSAMAAAARRWARANVAFIGLAPGARCRAPPAGHRARSSAGPAGPPHAASQPAVPAAGER